jgi:hypothetical protein
MANAYMMTIQNFRFWPDKQPEVTIIEAWHILTKSYRIIGAPD